MHPAPCSSLAHMLHHTTPSFIFLDRPANAKDEDINHPGHRKHPADDTTYACDELQKAGLRLLVVHRHGVKVVVKINPRGAVQEEAGEVRC